MEKQEKQGRTNNDLEIYINKSRKDGMTSAKNGCRKSERARANHWWFDSVGRLDDGASGVE